MAKLKSSFGRQPSTKLPGLSTGSPLLGSLPKAAAPKNVSSRTLTVTNTGSVVQALTFGALHTKVTGSASSSQWNSLLGAATSGGASSLISGGILSTGALGFVGRLLSLFGGSKSTPAAPTPFVMPASQQRNLNVAPSSGASSVSLGVQSNSSAGTQGGPIYQSGSVGIEQSTQSSQVVQIVKQALLTSSSLNDVISEI